MSEFELVVGVDQTGAKVSGGGAKPLPTAIMIKSKKGWKLLVPLMLKSFNKKNIESLLCEFKLTVDWSAILIVADCVLGLPEKIVGSKDPLTILRSSMSKASVFEGVGLKAGESFFLTCFPNALEKDDSCLVRRTEKNLGCLSVFKNKPFQKNVQTGTYRIWSDLGKEKEYLNFNIWPYEKGSGRAYLCEGYPAHAKEVVKKLACAKIENFHLYQEVSKDHKDAAALAVLGALFFDSAKNIKYKKEGRILTAADYKGVD